MGRVVVEDQEASRARAAAYFHGNVVFLAQRSVQTAAQRESERVEKICAFLGGISAALASAEPHATAPSARQAENGGSKKCEELLCGIGKHLA